MPDISMCNSMMCLKTDKCYRHMNSGTKPNKYMQSWCDFEPDGNGECKYFYPITPPTDREV